MCHWTLHTEQGCSKQMATPVGSTLARIPNPHYRLKSQLGNQTSSTLSKSMQLYRAVFLCFLRVQFLLNCCHDDEFIRFIRSENFEVLSSMLWFPAPTKLSHICHTIVRGRQPQDPISMFSASSSYLWFPAHPINTSCIFLTNQQWANGGEQMLPIWARAAPSQIASAIVYNLALPCHHAMASNFPKYLCHLSRPEADQLHMWDGIHLPPIISNRSALVSPLGVFDMPNPNRYDILSIPIFCKNPLSISIFSRLAISISI